jgi:hypothetical protein
LRRTFRSFFAELAKVPPGLEAVSPKHEIVNFCGNQPELIKAALAK